MSIEEVKFQLFILQRRMYKCAIDLEQVFGQFLKEALKGQRADAENIRKTVENMRKNDDTIATFTIRMNKLQRDVRHAIGTAIAVSTRIYHFSRARSANVVADDTVWENVFKNMCRTVYVRPEMYTASSLPLYEVLKLIENVLDTVVYSEIPLNIDAIEAPETPKRTKHSERSNRARTPPPRKEKREERREERREKSFVSSVISEGSDEDTNSNYREVQQIMKHRKSDKTRGSPVGSSSIVTHTEGGKMDIIIPSKK